jgi:hypothetical protein
MRRGNFEILTAITENEILCGIRIAVDWESFRILPPLFHEMTEVGHILAKFKEDRTVSFGSIFKSSRIVILL